MRNAYYTNQDVFITFRGKDERNKLLSYIKQKLLDGKVDVKTDEDLTGQHLDNIFVHIINSKVVIVIFSENFPNSNWCLDEVELIKKCIETDKVKAVIPIFHKVTVESVKKQSEAFGETFMAKKKSLLAKEGITEDKIEEIKLKIGNWRNALQFVTEMAGLPYHDDRYDFGPCSTSFCRSGLDVIGFVVNIPCDLGLEKER